MKRKKPSKSNNYGKGALRQYKWLQLMLKPGKPTYLPGQHQGYHIPVAVATVETAFFTNEGPWGCVGWSMTSSNKPRLKDKEQDANEWSILDPKRPDGVNFWVRLKLQDDERKYIEGKAATPDMVLPILSEYLTIPALGRMVTDYLLPASFTVKIWMFQNDKYRSLSMPWGFNSRETIFQLYATRAEADADEYGCGGYHDVRHVATVDCVLSPDHVKNVSTNKNKRQKISSTMET